MATSDLLAELGKDSFRVDPELERRLCAAVAVQLEDISGDISGLAVKWWAPLSGPRARGGCAPAQTPCSEAAAGAAEGAAAAPPAARAA
jgi:hypothetical protein